MQILSAQMQINMLQYRHTPDMGIKSKGGLICMNLNPILSELLGIELFTNYTYILENKVIYYQTTKGYRPLRAYKRSEGQYGRPFYVFYEAKTKQKYYISETKLKKIIEEKLKNGSQEG